MTHSSYVSQSQFLSSFRAAILRTPSCGAKDALVIDALEQHSIEGTLQVGTPTTLVVEGEAIKLNWNHTTRTVSHIGRMMGY